jgi:hypothetical protein
MDRIEIGMSRKRFLQIADEARVEFEAPDTSPAGTAEYQFMARDNLSGDQVVVRFSNDDMERDDITDEIYVEVD